MVFWWSQDSNVTPPVALAGFAGAAIAGSKPMETSIQAWKYAKGLYLIPLFMIYNDSIILGGPLVSAVPELMMQNMVSDYAVVGEGVSVGSGESKDAASKNRGGEVEHFQLFHRLF